MAIDSAQIRRFLGHSAKTGGDPSFQDSTIEFLRFFTLHHPSFLTVHAFTLLFVLASSGCQKNPVVPPDRLLPDTTSHAFTWKIDTLGDGGSSVLYDVAIINDTLAYAVGEIYLKDSSGQIDPTAYSIAIWNGSDWSVQRLYYQSGTSQNLITPIRGIWAFGQNDVWLAAGSIFQWNGSSSLTQMSFSRLSLADPNATVEKLWGTSNTNLYGVGHAGTIMHFDGSQWEKIESGTTTDMQDIWGATVNGQTEVVALASYANYGYGLDLFWVQPSGVTKLDTAGLALFESSLWFAEPGKHYVAGDGLFSKGDLSDPGWQQERSIPSYYIRRIRGTASNDVFIAGDFGLLAHYNGSTWSSYMDTALPSFQGAYESLSIRGNTVVAVGVVQDRAIAVIGKR